MSTKIPERISKYKIIDILGKGGMGYVYKASQEPLNRIVALKILPQEYSLREEFHNRFLTEAKAISKLEHQNIVGIYDYGMDNGIEYIAMRYIEGMSLADKIEKEKKLDCQVAVEYAKQICRALKYAHRRGIVHRDIKPQNILLDKENRLFVTDFGIAKLFQQTNITRTGVVVGTPEYMSPEQAEGLALNNQTDIYSLGIVLYEMLCGNPPFTGENPLSIAYQHVNVQPEPLNEKIPEIPKRLNLIVLKALKKDTNFRYKNVDSFLNDLDSAFAENEITSDITRDMSAVNKIKGEELFLQEKRIVDRRSGDRRNSLRRTYKRRKKSSIGDKIKLFSIALLISLIGGFIVFSILWRMNTKQFGLKIDYTSNDITLNPAAAFDGNTFTYWKSKEKNSSFSYQFSDKKQKINRIEILSGNNISDETFYNYSRPKKISFNFKGHSEFEIVLKDKRNRQIFIIPETIIANEVNIKIGSIYPGNKYLNPCLTEVRFWNSAKK